MPRRAPQEPLYRQVCERCGGTGEKVPIAEALRWTHATLEECILCLAERVRDLELFQELD